MIRYQEDKLQMKFWNTFISYVPTQKCYHSIAGYPRPLSSLRKKVNKGDKKCKNFKTAYGGLK